MNILIADDHELIRDGLRYAIASEFQDSNVFSAGCAAEVDGFLNAGPVFDLVVLDLVMPGSGGFTLLRRLCERLPNTPVVVLSASDDIATMRQAFDCGASGFVPKTTPHDVMLGAFKLVLSGGVYVPPTMVGGAGGSGWRGASERDYPVTAMAHGFGGAGLTDRQREVLALLERGMQNKLIARQLGLSENTVKNHVTAILNALGAANRTQAVMFARQAGLSIASGH